MNELLKRIAEQAATEASKYCQRPFDLSKEENETFALCLAELIVRESAKIAAQDPLFLNYAENDKHMERDIINHSFKKVKKEFGIDQ